MTAFKMKINYVLSLCCGWIFLVFIPLFAFIFIFLQDFVIVYSNKLRTSFCRNIFLESTYYRLLLPTYEKKKTQYPFKEFSRIANYIVYYFLRQHQERPVLSGHFPRR